MTFNSLELIECMNDLQLSVDKGYFGGLNCPSDDVTGYFAAQKSCSIESAPKQRY
jgi:hypothetical protein